MKPKFKAVLGVDQTGAKGRLGLAKPLPSSLLLYNGKSFRLSSPLFLPALNKKSVEGLLELQGFKCEWSEVLVVADCVLGLPHKIVGDQLPFVKLKQMMEKAFASGGLGLKDGEKFFAEICEPFDLVENDLLRQQEKRLNCLSVFKNKPYQRNVQTGTYRIWSDLGCAKEYLNFNIWPYQKEGSRAFLCEGYPANAKRVLDLDIIDSILDVGIYDELSKDHQDATALALLGTLFFDPSNEIKENIEGEILTAPFYEET